MTNEIDYGCQKMDIDIFSLFFILAIYLLGIITTTISKVISDLLSEPYHRWKYQKEIKNENVEAVISLIADFCSSWELFRCKSVPYIDLELVFSQPYNVAK